jgi:hypothetical protein
MDDKYSNDDMRGGCKTLHIYHEITVSGQIHVPVVLSQEKEPQ